MSWRENWPPDFNPPGRDTDFLRDEALDVLAGCFCDRPDEKEYKVVRSALLNAFESGRLYAKGGA